MVSTQVHPKLEQSVDTSAVSRLHLQATRDQNYKTSLPKLTAPITPS